MTGPTIPVTTGNPGHGFEGYRFVGYNFYGSLALWDLSKADAPSDIKPGLATSWEIDPEDHNRWIVQLREGVKFHEGCSFTADDVVWNIQFRSDQKAPYFFAQQFAYTRTFLTNFKSVSKIDEHTAATDTNFMESLFPYSRDDDHPMPGEEPDLRLGAIQRVEFSRGLLDPVNAIINLVGKAYWAPAGSNGGHYDNPEAENLVSRIFSEFDATKRLALLTELHELEGARHS